jgi:hypothetical protein
MREHYDPAYARSQRGNFLQLQTAQALPAERLTAEAIAALGPALRALGGDGGDGPAPERAQVPGSRLSRWRAKAAAST